MFRKSKPQPLALVPLSGAMLCVDCESIALAVNDGCPGCRSRSLVSVARAVGGIPGAERVARLRIDDPRTQQELRTLVDSAEIVL